MQQMFDGHSCRRRISLMFTRADVGPKGKRPGSKHNTTDLWSCPRTTPEAEGRGLPTPISALCLEERGPELPCELLQVCPLWCSAFTAGVLCDQSPRGWGKECV